MRSSFTFKTLGLCALMIGVMAISAGGAGATVGSAWMVGGVNITGAGSSASLQGSLENNEGRLLTTINGLVIETVCTNATLNGVKLTKDGSTTEGDVKFTGCQLFKVSPKLEKLGFCTIHSPGQPAGTILSLPGKLLLELHTGNKPVVLVIPTSGVFSHVIFEEEEEACGVLPEEILNGGTLVIEDCEGKLATEQKVHLFVEEKALSHLWTISDTAEHKITLDGSVLWELADGLLWSGLPN